MLVTDVMLVTDDVMLVTDMMLIDDVMMVTDDVMLVTVSACLVIQQVFTRLSSFFKTVLLERHSENYRALAITHR